MSREERERLRLQAKEEKNNPGGALNNALARGIIGSPDRGCLVNIVSVAMVIAVILLFRACSG